MAVTPADTVEPEAEDFADVLRRLLRTELLRGECSVGEVAELCLIHRRTLSRRLRAEGTAFRRLSDEVRFEIACRLLLNPRMTFAQIARTLGFSEASAFTRAFRRWSGQTPTAWRAGHLRSRRARPTGRAEIGRCPKLSSARPNRSSSREVDGSA